MREQNVGETKRLYYVDSEMKDFQAVVTTCGPAADVTGGKRKEGYGVILAETAFFPEGGGQPGDIGTLGEAKVLDTVEVKGEIVHITDKPVEEGSTVSGKINWEVRYDRMQQHSAEHIVSGLACSRYGYQNVGFHIGEDKTTLDFNGPLTAEEVKELEIEANKVIYQMLPVETMFPTKEEEKKLEYRSKIDIEGQVRIVYIDGVDMCACCAPHVKNTGEIGIIKITDAINYKGGMRLTIVCGLRAVKNYVAEEDALRSISRNLSVPIEAAACAVEKLKAETEDRRQRIIAWQEKYVSRLETEKTDKNIIFEEELDGDVAKRLINKMAEKTRIAAAFIGTDEKGYHYIIGSGTEDLQQLTRPMHEALSGRGGGKGGQVQGQVAATRADIENYFKNI